MRQVMSTALVAVIVGALAGVTAGTLAQPPGEAERVITPTGFNADKVDGKHAVRATKMLRLRKNKLVATDRTGFLPDNIVQPLWHLIKNKPVGFADNVDNEGVTRARVTRVRSATVALPAGPGAEASAIASCPAGSVVVGGGGYGNGSDVSLSVTFPESATSWRAWATNNGTETSRLLWAYAVCMSIEPAALLGVASRGNLAPAGKRR